MTTTVRIRNFLISSALWAASETSAQAGSAIISLVMAPPGGEGFSVLNAAAPFATGAASAYFNPALLADISRSTGSQLHYSESDQELLPILGIRDLRQVFEAGAVVFADPKTGEDLGVGFYRNEVSFGWNYAEDAQRGTITPYISTETVHALAVGLRLAGPISVGGAIKHFDSRLAKGRSSGGVDLEGRAVGWAFDAGLFANPRLRTGGGWPGPFLEFVPSVSTMVQNMGPDAFYNNPSQGDPIPLQWHYALGLQVNAGDLVRVEAGLATEKDLAERKGWADFDNEPVRHYGLSGEVVFYRYSKGWLKDNPGKRDEEHISHAFSLDMLGAYRFWRRFSTGDFRSAPEALEKGFPFPWTRVLGFPFRANPRFTYGKRKIRSYDNGIRGGQESTFMSISL